MTLLDTHALIWLRLGADKLGPKTRQTIDEAWKLRQLCISAITFWEISLLIKRGRLRLAWDVGLWRKELLRQGFQEVPVDGQAGIDSVALENLAGDPADRMIVATAVSKYLLITADQRILQWSGPLESLDART